MQIVNVPATYDGKKLDTFLLRHFNGLGYNTFYKALRKKDIRVNDVRVNDNVVIHANDEIKVFIPDNLLYKQLEVKTIYEDDNILAVCKPIDIEVTGPHSLTELLQKSYTFIKPCHRLDRNTFGIVLFAKNQTALSILLEKFKMQEIEKRYLAKVYGIPQKHADTLTAYLFKDRKKSMVYISNIPEKGYVKITTSYQLLQKNVKENTSLLDIELHTGRTHQIRAHLAHIGYPIIGDGKYGVNQINKKFGKETQMLCSYSLTFRFTTPAGLLDYLNNKTISLNQSDLSSFGINSN